MSARLTEAAMRVETVDDVIRWTNGNLETIASHMNWLEKMTKDSFKDARADFEIAAKKIKKLERRSRMNWLVTAIGFAVAGYFLKDVKDKINDEIFFDATDTEGLENRVDYLTKRVNELERSKWTAENKE